MSVKGLHYVRRGGGDKRILLIHGNMASAKWWKPAMENMDFHYDLLAVDLRGYGQSPDGNNQVSLQDHVNDIRTIVDSLDFSPCMVVGHSLGGAVAMQMAASCPDLLTGMVLVDAPPLGGMQNCDYALLTSLLQKDELLVASLRMTAVEKIDENFFDELAADCLRSKAAIIPNTHALEAFDLRKAAGNFVKPVLVMHGEKDPLIPLAVAEEAAQTYPHAELIVLKGVGHNPQVERSVDFVQLLEEFLKTL